MKMLTKIIVPALLMLAISIPALAGRPEEKVNPAPRVNDDAVIWRGAKPTNARGGDVWINPIDSMEMVFVKRGYFHMGNDQIADEKPFHHVFVESYWISKYEVTVGQYKKFCDVSQHPMAKEPAMRWLTNSPIVNVDWNDALAYAKWANGRLITEAEWEKAARFNKYTYPWGNGWDATKCNNGLDGKNAPTKVGSYPAGASEYGVMDMAGNVAEWCADQFLKEGDMTINRRIRGGSCVDINAEAYRATRRDNLVPSTKNDVIGIRYAINAN